MLKAAQYPIKKRIKLYGFDISIENPKGSTRTWKDPHSGESGSTKMRWDYGYIRRTEGTDGDHVDVYVGPMPESTKVFVINQMKKPDFKEFDEQKVMLAFPNAVAAKSAYLKQYNDPRFFGSMKEMSVEDFRKKVLDKDFHGKKVAQVLHTAGGAIFGGAAADSQVGAKIAEEKDMPFKSKRQQRAAFGGHIPGFSKEKAREWAHETPNLKKLPDRAPAEKGKPTLLSKESQLAHAHDKGTGLEKREILEGLQVEKEHTKNPAVARQIAIDHIRERPDYYEKLEKMEKSPMDPKVKARLKEAAVDALYFAELNLDKLAAGDELVDTGRVLGEKKRGVGDEIPPQTEFAQAIQGDSIKAAKDDRVGRIADRVDDVGIGVLAAPYAADLVGHGLAKVKNPKLQAAGHALSRTLGNESAFGKSHARELIGLGLVAPGITHRVAKGIDRAMPEKKAAIATYEQLRQAGSEPARQISEEISKERRAAIEKVASQLYPDWEYLTNEKQADVIAGLGRLAQKGKGLVQQVAGGHGVPGVHGPGTALMSHLREGAQSFGRDLAAIPGNIAEAVKDVGGRAASKLERRFAAGQRLERIRAGGHTPGLVGGGAGATPIPVTRAHPAVPAPASAASRATAATERAAVLPPAPAPVQAPSAAPAAASSTEAKTVAGRAGGARPAASAEAKTVAKGKGGGPYREPAAAPAAAAAAAPAAAAQKGPGPVTQAWAGSPAAGQAPPKKSLARRLLPALAVGGTAVGLGGTALAAGHGLSALQRAQEETTGAPPIAPPTFVGPGRVP